MARGEHGRALQSGLVLEAPGETVTLPIPTVTEPAAGVVGGDADGDPVVLLAVKGQHTDHALDAAGGGASRPRRWSACRTAWRTSAASCATSRTPTACASCAPPPSCGPASSRCIRPPSRDCSTSGRFPSGVDERGQAIADAIATTTFQSVARPDIMRWKYRKLLMNLANAVEALAGPEGRFGPLAREAQREGKEALAAAGIDGRELRGGPGAARRLPADGADLVGGVAGGLQLAEPRPAVPGRSRPSSSTARSCCWAASTACRRRSTPSWSAWRSGPRPRVPAPGTWRIEELSELAGVPHGE